MSGIARDPVCHMEIEQERVAAERRHGGALFCFCSIACAEQFDRTPEAYLSPAPAAYPPISAYALIGDAHSAALVSRDGSVDWCCFHRFDGRPVFARLLDWSRGGYFRIAPVGRYAATRRYLPETNVLETRFEASAGVIVLTDCFPVRPPTDSQGAVVEPYHQLLRLVRCDRGQVQVRIDFAPRFDFGLTVPRLELRDPDIAVVYGGADALVFQSQTHLIHPGLADCHTELTLHDGQEVSTALTYGLPHELRVERLDHVEITRRVERTRRFWEAWAARCRYRGPYRDSVLRSALVLKALTNAPTGAIVAAPTTSLPEAIGGERNWDYRYTWLRDTALTLSALFTLGYTDEAHAFMTWLKRTTAGRAKDLRVMYGVGGERLLPEIDLVELEGYRGSRPVRIGNAASAQFQLDVYGYLLDTAWLYHRHAGEIDAAFWELLQGAVAHVAEAWTAPDQGIWEVRSEPRHFVSSKVMAWVAVDRGIRLARTLGLEADLERWERVRAEIRRRVEADGVDAASGAFVQAFGSPVLDASNLLIPLVGFLPPHDPRVRATVERTERELARKGLVYRYVDGDDGVRGDEGTFVICSWWLVDNLALAGNFPRARQLFERLLGYGNDLGLFAEQVDPITGEFLGNFPQAFSHVGLIGAAMNLDKGARRQLGP